MKDINWLQNQRAIWRIPVMISVSGNPGQSTNVLPVGCTTQTATVLPFVNTSLSPPPRPKDEVLDLEELEQIPLVSGIEEVVKPMTQNAEFVERCAHDNLVSIRDHVKVYFAEKCGCMRVDDLTKLLCSPLAPLQAAQVDAESAAVESLTDDSDSLRSTPIRGRICLMTKKKYEKTVNDLMGAIERLQNVPGVDEPKQVLETRKQRAVKILHNTNTELITPNVQASTSTPVEATSTNRRRKAANTELGNNPKQLRLSLGGDQPGTSGSAFRQVVETLPTTGHRRRSQPKPIIPPVLDERSDSGMERPIEEDNVNLPLSEINMTPSMRLVNKALVLAVYSKGYCQVGNQEQYPVGHPLRVANYAANFGWRLNCPYINGRLSMVQKRTMIPGARRPRLPSADWTALLLIKFRGTLNRIVVDDHNPRLYECIFENAYFRGVYQWMLLKFPYELTPYNNRAFMRRVKKKLRNNSSVLEHKLKKDKSGMVDLWRHINQIHLNMVKAAELLVVVFTLLIKKLQRMDEWLVKIKPKNNYFCDICRYGTRRRAALITHINKNHYCSKLHHD